MLITEKSLRKIIRSVLLEVPLGFVDTIPKRNSDDASRSDSEINTSKPRPSIGAGRHTDPEFVAASRKIFEKTEGTYHIFFMEDIKDLLEGEDHLVDYLMSIENIKSEDYILVVASAPIPGDEIDPQYVIAHDIVGHTIDSPIYTNGLEENILKYISYLKDFLRLTDPKEYNLNSVFIQLSDYIKSRLIRAFYTAPSLSVYIADKSPRKGNFDQNLADDVKPDLFAVMFLDNPEEASGKLLAVAKEILQDTFNRLLKRMKDKMTGADLKAFNEKINKSIDDIAESYVDLFRGAAVQWKKRLVPRGTDPIPKVNQLVPF